MNASKEKTVVKKEVILIFGGAGLVGRALAETLAEKFPAAGVISLKRKDADITDPRAVLSVIRRFSPKVVINAAALASVEACEENPEEAEKANALGPFLISRALTRSDLRETIFVQLGTSEIFGNEKELYEVDDRPSPLNVYGRTKLAGEEAVIGELGGKFPYRIVRTSWLYGGERESFIDLVAKSLLAGKTLKVVADQHNFPVWVKDLAKGIARLLSVEKLKSGIYHFSSSSPERVSKYEIALFIAETLGLDKRLLERSKRADLFKVNRPGSAVLAHSSVFGAVDWQRSLKFYLKNQYGKKSEI